MIILSGFYWPLFGTEAIALPEHCSINGASRAGLLFTPLHAFRNNWNRSIGFFDWPVYTQVQPTWETAQCRRLTLIP
jgi:hypothetical protein